jgi:DNA-binding CsgD family transcriptional regulator
MTQKVDRTEHPSFSKAMQGDGKQAGEPEIGRPYPERIRTPNEVGSAIVHQLNGPLTALRLYMGEIRQHSGRLGTTETDDSLQQIVENAFQETERVCTMIRLIADTLEAPLHQEGAVELGRDVINWWTRSSGTEGGGNANGPGVADAASPQSIHALLTPRQREVLSHISQGCSNKQGALRMQIGPRTFESHRARVMQKFKARNAADLVRLAFGEHAATP